ncbi:MAG: calcium-binding protein [Planctomycetia bacterium]
MSRRRPRSLRTVARPSRSIAGVEPLESRVVLAAGMAYDRNTRTLSIVGSEKNDSAEVREQAGSIVVSMTSAAATSATPATRMTRTLAAGSVARIVFSGLAGNDTFANLSRIPSRADGGPGADVLRGGRAADELFGGDGSDQLMGEDGNDSLWGGAGNDSVWGGAGQDQLWGEGDNDQLWGGVGNDTIDAGAGNDSARGEDGVDVVMGGVGNDTMSGGAGNDDLQGGDGDDALDAGKGDDRLDGQVGRDRLVGGEGLDREVDPQDRFADGDDDGDGFDNDYDFMDITRDVPGNPRAFADDSAVAPLSAAVSDRLRAALQIPAADPGLRVRVQINGGTVSQPGQFGELVSGVWRYLTPDKIQVWAKWCYPASDPTRITLFAQYSYTGTLGDIAGYSNPANYAVSVENRLIAGYLSGPWMFVSWLPNAPAGFFYSAPNEQATGFPAPMDQLKTALGTLPEFTQNGDSFQGVFSKTAGLAGVQPILSLLRTINQVNRGWYGQLRSR